MTEKLSELEKQRERNAVEMDARCARTREYLASGKYPMKPDNPCLHMTDEEFKAYIRMRRVEFEERHKEKR